jgi:hypothetical protein
MNELRYQASTQTIQDIVNRFDVSSLNLEPGFQRQSVWKDTDRKKLIDSILRGYPLPALFMYKRNENGELVYDVIDGKQRLESILMFMGRMRGNRYAVKVPVGTDGSTEELDWKKLVRRGEQHRLTGYKVHVIEVEGDLSDMIDLFVRINSTGKPLTSQEKRHARYSTSPFLTAATKLAESLAADLKSNGVMSAAQMSRMKHIELTCELMLSAIQRDVVHKKAALDHVMSADAVPPGQLKRAQDETRAAMKKVFALFPQLKATRFRKISDFYSLVVMIQQFQRERLILSKRKPNALAADLLGVFSTGVDSVRARQRKVEGVTPELEVYRRYYLTVLEGTDSYEKRSQRHAILCSIFKSLFEQKDARRNFTEEQRRILWNTTKKKSCSSCRKALTWSDFTIDHIDPYSKGGRTRLDNAALMCGRCNSRKGNRRTRR